MTYNIFFVIFISRVDSRKLQYYMFQNMLLVLCLVFIRLLSFARADIIAYDCQDESVELTKLSLLRVKPCLGPRNATETITRRIQLIQKRQYIGVQVYTCLVVVQQFIQYCGMHSHTSSVAGGLGKYVHYVSAETCFKAHQWRHLDLRGMGGGIISKISLNGTTDVSTTLQGHLDVSGKCEGTKFTVGDVSYENVVVSAAITIQMSDYFTTADVERNIVRLCSGTVCSYNDGSCFDDFSGEAVWKTKIAGQCTNSGVDVLYEGNATLLTLSKDPPTFYLIVDTEDTVFALKLTKSEDLCHQRAWQTEQNRLLVILEDFLGFFYRKSLRLPQNTDLMTQVLSKLLYLEIAVKRQMADVVYDAIMKRCQLREKILQNRITMALQSPDLVGNLVKETTGYIGRVMGEVLYIAKCKPIIVDYRRTTTCYQELPVTYKNTSLFRLPMTHVITEHGTEIDCQPLLPPSFNIEGNWVELTPALRKAEPAIELDANTEDEIVKLARISPITSDGIYTREDMEKFQRTLMFPNERKAVTNEVARRVTGRGIGTDNYDMPKLFSESEFKNFAKSAAEEVWGFLSRMGNIFSICGFLYTTFCIVSYITGVITNYFTIKKIAKDHPHKKRYLWASLCQSLAHRYIYNLHRNSDPMDQAAIDNIELQEVRVNDTETSGNVASETRIAPSAPVDPSVTYPSLIPCNNPSCLGR